MIWLACTGTVSPPGKEPVCIHRLNVASNQESILINASGKTLHFAVQRVHFVDVELPYGSREVQIGCGFVSMPA